MFDQLSRLTDIIGAQTQTTLLAYDDNHNPTGQTDALTRQSSSSFDALDQLIQSTDPDLKQTGFTYDARGNLTSVTDAKGLITTYTYNGFDEVISQTSPDTGTTTFIYDKAGNPTSQTDARGITTAYTYDALNRLTQTSYPDSSLNVTYTYDENNAGQNGIGRLTTVIDASGTRTHAYDARGNLTRHDWQNTDHSISINYAYDAADRIAQITYPSGRTVDRTRNTAGQITAVTTTFNGETKTLANNISYLPFGPTNAMAYGNGLTYSASYDLDYQLDNQNTASVQQRDYTQDDVGNISSITDLIDTNHNQSFVYDNLDRLNSAQGNYGALGYGYDPIGNRLNKTTDGNAANYSYTNQSHQLQSISGSVTQSYQYDANGNTTDNGIDQFSYGDDNRLHSVSQNGTEIASYTYNAQGQRSSKTVSGITTGFHYNQNGQLIAETDAAGNTQQEYVWLNGQPLALVQTQQSTGSGGTSQTLDFEDQSLGEHASLNISGYRFSITDSVLEVLNVADVFWWADPNHSIQNSGWLETTVVEKTDGSAFDLQSLDYQGHWDNGTATLTGTLADGTQVSNSFNYTPESQPATKTLNWTNLTRVEIAFDSYAMMDNFVFSNAGTNTSSSSAIYSIHNDHLGTPQRLTDESQNIVWQAGYDAVWKSDHSPPNSAGSN